MAQEVAVAETTVPIDRECRVVRYGVVEIKAAELAIGEMEVDLLAQSPLEADAVTVAHDQHPDSMSSWSIEGRPMSL